MYTKGAVLFPGGSVVKNLPADAGDVALIPGSGGRSSGEGNGNSLQYSCLKNPMDRGAWGVTAHGSQRVRHDWVTKQQQQQNSCSKKCLLKGQKIIVDGGRYADDTTLMAESEELKNLLMKVREESVKVGLKLNIQKT